MHFIKGNRTDEENLHAFEARNKIMFFGLLPIDYAIRRLETKKFLEIEKRQRKRVESIGWKSEEDNVKRQKILRQE